MGEISQSENKEAVDSRQENVSKLGKRLRNGFSLNPKKFSNEGSK